MQGADTQPLYARGLRDSMPWYEHDPDAASYRMYRSRKALQGETLRYAYYSSSVLHAHGQEEFSVDCKLCNHQSTKIASRLLLPDCCSCLPSFSADSCCLGFEHEGRDSAIFACWSRYGKRSCKAS